MTNKADHFNDSLPTRLRELMQLDNVSQKQLAEALGITRQSISQYCDGSSQPALNKLVSIADYFGVSIDYLLGRSDVRAIDPQLQTVALQTGLTEKALLRLSQDHIVRAAINRLLESSQARSVADALCGYNYITWKVHSAGDKLPEKDRLWFSRVARTFLEDAKELAQKTFTSIHEDGSCDMAPCSDIRVLPADAVDKLRQVYNLMPEFAPKTSTTFLAVDEPMIQMRSDTDAEEKS